MLHVLQEFRDRLDAIMLRCMHDSVLLYGYESYTGRFIKWYAGYYHSIKINYLVSTDMSRGRAYDQEIFRPSILDFDYKDVRKAVIWVTEPVSPELERDLAARGYEKGKTWFDFFTAVYGTDIDAPEDASADIYTKRKSGRRDIQFLEWLEYKYDCNFVTRIKPEDIPGQPAHNSGYGCTTQKEIFPMLDHAHIAPGADDAIFDFGCGKGGALVSFLDYGFQRVGGVEYDAHIYTIAQDNMKRLHLEDRAELLHGDAAELTTEIDGYNWFYFYLPFDETITRQVIANIKESSRRVPRQIGIVFFSAMKHDYIEADGVFRLTNQFTVDMRQRVVAVFENAYKCAFQDQGKDK